MSIGTNIRRRRLELGLSQKELASSMGYRSRSAIANIESGKSEFPASRLLDLSRVLDTSVESLLSDLAPTGTAASELGREGSIRRAAVILAGGKSSRNLQNVPNQFVNVLGRPVISWCLATYQRHPMVDDIVVVCLEGWEDVVGAFARQGGVSKLRAIVPAGSTGARSFVNGVRRLEGMGYHGDDMVVVQESTRPQVTQEMVTSVLLACAKAGSAVTCHAMTDNVQFVQGDDGWSYVDRESIVDLQSPDAHRMSLLVTAIEEATRLGSPLEENSCTMMLHALGRPLNFCECDRPNMKIVRQNDLAIFETLVRRSGSQP